MMCPDDPHPREPVSREDPRLALGRQVARLRRARGLSQEALARRSGLSRSYLASLERGHRNVGLVNLHRLATALDLALADLFPLEADDGPPTG